jgi:hypothetical protein
LESRRKNSKERKKKEKGNEGEKKRKREKKRDEFRDDNTDFFFARSFFFLFRVGFLPFSHFGVVITQKQQLDGLVEVPLLFSELIFNHGRAFSFFCRSVNTFIVFSQAHLRLEVFISMEEGGRASRVFFLSLGEENEEEKRKKCSGLCCCFCVFFFFFFHTKRRKRKFTKAGDRREA